MAIHLKVTDHVVAMTKVIVGQKVSGQKVLHIRTKSINFFFILHLLLYKTYVSHCTFTAQRSICYLYICC